MIQNELHAFDEIPTIENGKRSWHRMDLGGSDVLDLTEEDKRKNIFDEIKNMPDPTPVSNEAPSSIKPSLLTKFYKQQLRPFIEENLLDSWEPLLEKQNFTPLLHLKAHETRRVND